MDLLYHRYASPFDYLQNLLDMGQLADGVLAIIDQDNERKLWELYLHSFANVSFDDWKKKVASVNNKPNEMDQKDVITEVNKSNEILKNFQLEREA